MVARKDPSLALAALPGRTVAEAAKIGGVSPGTLRAAMRAAGIAHRKPGPKTSRAALDGVAMMLADGASASEAARRVGVDRVTIVRAVKRAGGLPNV